MGRKAIDRTGEERINSFGSKMIIKEYRTNSDIDVYFPEYNCTFECTNYGNFKRGNIKCLRIKNSKRSLRYGIVCYRDVMILNFIKKSLLIKDVK